MKKIALILGSLLGLLVVAAALLPFFVDVDRYRPLVVDKANQSINGRLELGKLTLSLWGRILVRVDGVSLHGADGKEMLSVKDAYFLMPFSSLLSGSPALTFKMERPAVVVVKAKDGKLNLLTLVKATPVSQPASAPAASAKAATSVPALAAKARLSVELRDADFSYHDEATGLKNHVSGLNLVVKDISLSRPLALELWADDINTQLAGAFSVAGPCKVKADFAPEFSGAELKHFKLRLTVDLDRLVISAGGAFHKGAGVPFHFDARLNGDPKQVRIEDAALQFHNARVDIKGGVTQLGAASPIVQASLESNEIVLAPWTELVPALKGLELGGTLRLKAQARGPLDKLDYDAGFSITELTAASPALKAKPVFNLDVAIAPDRVKSLRLTMKAPGNDLTVSGQLASFSAPQAQFSVESSGLDLDRLLNSAPKAAASAPAGTAGGPAASLDAQLAPLRANPVLAKAAVDLRIAIRSLQAQGVRVTDIQTTLSLKKLVASVNALRLGIFGGSVQAQASVDLKPAAPSYAFKAEVKDLDLNAAAASQMALLKNTLFGKLSLQADGSGASLDAGPAKKNLRLKGKFKVVDATFASLDVGKMAVEALNGSLGKVADKVPALKGMLVKGMAGQKAVYKSISSDFSLAGGRLDAPDFAAEAAPNQGIDLKGSTSLNIIDNGLIARWQVIDRYNLTHARDLAISAGGFKAEHVLARGNDPVTFPVSVGCTLTAPCYKYSEVPEALASVVFANMGDAAKEKAKSAARQQAAKFLDNAAQQAPAPVQKALRDLGKNLFH